MQDESPVFPYQQMEKFTVTLTGCTDGVGVGLDAANRVDMLVPDKPAVGVLQMGDRIVAWNGIEMFDGANRRLLKDVVVPAETHELVIERARYPTIDGMVGREPMVPADLNVDDDKEETFLFGALALTIVVLVISASGTFSEWIPK